MTNKPKESIIYLNNPDRLLRRSNGTDDVILKMKLLVVDSPGTNIFLTITFLVLAARNDLSIVDPKDIALHKMHFL